MNSFCFKRTWFWKKIFKITQQKILVTKTGDKIGKTCKISLSLLKLNSAFERPLKKKSAFEWNIKKKKKQIKLTRATYDETAVNQYCFYIIQITETLKSRKSWRRELFIDKTNSSIDIKKRSPLFMVLSTGNVKRATQKRKSCFEFKNGLKNPRNKCFLVVLPCILFSKNELAYQSD